MTEGLRSRLRGSCLWKYWVLSSETFSSQKRSFVISGSGWRSSNNVCTCGTGSNVSKLLLLTYIVSKNVWVPVALASYNREFYLGNVNFVWQSTFCRRLAVQRVKAQCRNNGWQELLRLTHGEVKWGQGLAKILQTFDDKYYLMGSRRHCACNV